VAEAGLEKVGAAMNEKFSDYLATVHRCIGFVPAGEAPIKRSTAR